MGTRFIARLAYVGVFAWLCAGCSTSKTPTPGEPSSATARPLLGITSVTVTSERGPAGLTYRVVAQLRESGGVAAPVAAIELTFMNGSTTLVTSRFEQVLPSSGNVCPAGGIVTSRELVATDTASGHAAATTVAVRVLYGDAGAVATSTANVPAPVDVPVSIPTFTISGTITDQSNGQVIAGARVEAINGANAGKNVLTDGFGNYALSGLTQETFRMRASAAGYDPGEQNVTVPDNARADFAIRRSASAACVYAMVPNGLLDVARVGGTFSITLTRTSGSCGWQASNDVSWITLGALSGGDSATLSYTVTPNAAFVPRFGVITVRWNGGEATLTLRQLQDSPATCQITVTANNPSTVPTGGGTYTAQVALQPGVPPNACGFWAASSSSNPPLTFPGGATGPTPGSFTFTVPANGTGQSRTFPLSVTVGGSSQLYGLVITQSQ